MWALDNRTPYAAERNWVRDGQGLHQWIVAVKATFDIGQAGRLQLADEQPPPVLAPEYFGEPGASSLRYDADLGLQKPTTDVIVNAHAYAPGGKPAAKVPVRLRLSSIDKTLIVHGPRIYYRGAMGVSLSQARPFAKLPITYEWAFGGTDTSDPDPQKQRIDARNPIGKGVAMRSSSLVEQLAHTIEYPQGNPAKVGPAGFGAIASYWSPRLELGGTYDARWEKTRKPLLPDDYDDRFVLCSPWDQRPAQHLRGAEPVELLNLSETGVLRTVLPKIYLTFSTRFGRRAQEHRAKVTSVMIEPEENRLAMVWQTSLPVGSTAVDYLDETTIAEKPYLT